jgi:uncharacterized protein with ATP-grasp and redox domains
MNLRTDRDVLPPPLLTSEEGSFAHNTLKVRVPSILLDTLDRNDFPPDVVADLQTLHREITSGYVRLLREDAADVAAWNATAAPHAGRTWLDVPWYWAEAYFYRRLLEATRYFQPGRWRGFDPFATTKQTEWAPHAAPAAVATLLETLSEDPVLRLEQLLHASLWGNRADLSYTVATHLGVTSAPDHERSNLLVDDLQAVSEYIRGRDRLKLGILADNAGTELLMDLVLADFLLTHELAGRIEIHLKPQPFFVSDGMIKDLADGTDALIAAGGEAGKLGRRLDAHVAAGDLVPLDHGFYASSSFYFDMPDDLYRDLAKLDLVMVKGDANYRRLIGDAHWPYTTPFSDIMTYFPAPAVALRTLKSEVAVGLAAGQAERLAEEDPNWRVNGRRGVIQAALQRKSPGDHHQAVV